MKVLLGDGVTERGSERSILVFDVHFDVDVFALAVDHVLGQLQHLVVLQQNKHWSFTVVHVPKPCIIT